MVDLASQIKYQANAIGFTLFGITSPSTLENSIIFEIHNEQAIYNAMKTGAEWDDYQILKAQSVSLENAKKFGPEQFAHSLKNLIEILSRN